jgi:hypothetical protein
MVLAHTKRVQPDLVRVFDLLDQLSQTVHWIHRTAVLVEGRGKAVNPHLHDVGLRRRSSGPG